MKVKLMMDNSKTTLVDALFARLPPEDCEWPIAERAKWLRVAAAIIDLLYGKLPEGRLEVRINRDWQIPPGAGDVSGAADHERDHFGLISAREGAK